MSIFHVIENLEFTILNALHHDLTIALVLYTYFDPNIFFLF